MSRGYSIDHAVDREGREVELVDLFDRLVVALEDLVVERARRARGDAVSDVFFACIRCRRALGRALHGEVVRALLLEAAHVLEPLVPGFGENALFSQRFGYNVFSGEGPIAIRVCGAVGRGLVAVLVLLAGRGDQPVEHCERLELQVLFDRLVDRLERRDELERPDARRAVVQLHVCSVVLAHLYREAYEYLEDRLVRGSRLRGCLRL